MILALNSLRIFCMDVSFLAYVNCIRNFISIPNGQMKI